MRLALARAGVKDDPVGADPVAHPQGVLERGSRVARTSRSLLAQLIR